MGCNIFLKKKKCETDQTQWFDLDRLDGIKLTKLIKLINGDDAWMRFSDFFGI